MRRRVQTAAVRRELYERHPWIARSLHKALEEPLRLARDGLPHRNALKVMPPRPHDHVRETLDVLGDDFWAYGLERNRHVLDRFAACSHERGLAKRRWPPEQIVLGRASEGYVL